MRLIGYCTECRHVRYVRVSAQQMALAGRHAGVMQGVCADCEEKQREQQRGRGQR